MAVVLADGRVRGDVPHQLRGVYGSNVQYPSWSHTILPFYGILMMLCGLCAGIGGLFAIIRRRERSWLGWLTLLPGLPVLFILLGEFLFPH